MSATFSHFSAARKAHLLFSPGVARRTLACVVLEAAFVLAVSKTPSLRSVADEVLAAVEFKLLQGAHSLAWWSVVAMLASSCCALQIILSAASVGCSGLNGLLGPIRPPMLAATVLLQASAWHVVMFRKPEQAAPVALGSAITVVLTLLPELLHLVEASSRRRRPAAAAGGVGEELQLKLTKVGCTACEVKVRSVAEACTGVVRCDVNIDTGVATVGVAAGADVAAVRATLTTALAKAGYERVADSDCASCDAAAGGDACVRKSAVPMAKKLPGATSSTPWWSDERLGALVGGLLGSSCCAVQLGLNLLASLGVGLFGVGCAGFNTYLGPLRPYLRAATAIFFAGRWAACRPKRRGALLLWTLLAVALTMLPELLLHAGAAAIAPPSDGAVRISLQVEGMGCEACQIAVTGVLQRASGVLDATADFEAGKAQMLVQPTWGFNLTQLAAAVEDAGFELNVSSAVVDGASSEVA